MKLKVKMNDRHRVESVEVDDKTADWIEKHQQANQGKLPNVPKWMFAVLNIRDDRGYRSLTNSNESLVVSKQLEVTPFSGQWWQSIRIDQKAELLELVEWLGNDVDQYVRDSEVMYPADRPQNYRRLFQNNAFEKFRG